MGTLTHVDWTTHTWNPWRGCDEVSRGCDRCYARGLAQRYGWDFSAVQRTSSETWRKPFSRAWREPAFVFTCSIADFFHVAADAWRREAWGIIRRTPHLTYQVLTKRPGRIARHLPPDWGPHGYPNVWLGTSVEDQQWAEARIPALLAVPATVHFLSCEPLLGPLDLIRWLGPGAPGGGVGWVITGGESGPDRRPADPAWFRAVRDQCVRAGVAFWHKQGNHVFPAQDRLLAGRTWEQLPDIRRPAGPAAPVVRQLVLV